MNEKTQAGSPASIGCSPADGPLVPHNPLRSPADDVRIECSGCGLKSAIYFDDDGAMLDDCEWCYTKFDKAQIDAARRPDDA